MENSKNFLDVKSLKRQAKGRWEEILMAVAGDKLEDAIYVFSHNKRKHCYCPIHGGNNGDAFRLMRDFNETGGSVCNTCGAFPDGFETLMFVEGCSLNEACKIINNYLNGTFVSNHTPKPRPKIISRNEYTESPEKSLRRITSLWQKTLEITDSASEPLKLYLEKRCIPIQTLLDILGEHHGKVVRFHPALPYYSDDLKLLGRFPAMVYKFTQPDGKGVTVHRTYFNEDGTRINIENANTGIIEQIKNKKIVAIPSDRSLSGSACRLGPVINGKLGVAEGFETAISARIHNDGDHNVWPTYNDIILSSFVPPKGVTELVIWADRDLPQRNLDGVGAGEFYARKLAERMKEIGVKTKILIPYNPMSHDLKIDWNDVICSNIYNAAEIDSPKKGVLSLFTNLAEAITSGFF